MTNLPAKGDTVLIGPKLDIDPLARICFYRRSDHRTYSKNIQDFEGRKGFVTINRDHTFEIFDPSTSEYIDTEAEHLTFTPCNLVLVEVFPSGFF